MTDKKEKQGNHCFPEFASPQGSGDTAGHGRHAPPESLEQKVLAAEAQSYEDAYHQSRTTALAPEMARMKPLNQLMATVAATLETHRDQIRQTGEEDTVRLAVAMAREIIHHETLLRPDLVEAILSKTLTMACGQEKTKVRAHPQDCGTIRKLQQAMAPDEDSRGTLHLNPDPAMERGGCLVETDFGIIDARIDQQLATIAEELSAALVDVKAAHRGNAPAPSALALYRHKIKSCNPIKVCGHVTQVVGLVVEANGPVVQLGSICDIHGSDTERPVAAEVLGFRDRTVLLMPLEEIRTIGPGSRVVARQGKAAVCVGPKLLGRVIDGLGHPIDARGPLDTVIEYPIYTNPINPLLRQRIQKPLDLGIRAINGLLSVGCGQRMGIFAGSGVGKSVLMGMIARNSLADVNVIALIGERGRELNDFIEKDLGEEGLRKSVVIVATSDHLPLVRVRGAFVATAIAEYFRDQGLTVNLMMDSLTRFAMAQREIGLALGEPPTTKGYTPSVFTLLPKLLERAGTSDHSGSITGLYTVLVEGDDMNEPIADSARSILDGHIVLSRELAHQNHYPAIDVLHSISRVMEDIATLQHKHNAGRLKELLATYRKSEDLINIGAYVSGSNPAIDRAIAKYESINGYLRQAIGENVNFEKSVQQLELLMNSK